MRLPLHVDKRIIGLVDADNVEVGDASSIEIAEDICRRVNGYDAARADAERLAKALEDVHGARCWLSFTSIDACTCTRCSEARAALAAHKETTQ